MHRVKIMWFVGEGVHKARCVDCGQEFDLQDTVFKVKGSCNRPRLLSVETADKVATKDTMK